MSYTAADAVRDAERKLAAVRVMAERHPDARLDGLPDGSREWCSAELARPDRVRMVADKTGMIWICPYVLVEGMPLFVDSFRWEGSSVVLSRLNGGAYQHLVWAVLFDGGVPEAGRW